jgi:predicted MFS family arabinose efflux permease
MYVVRTYRELFTVPEFRVLFGSQCLMVVAGSVASLALGTIMYDATGSPLLTGLSMFGGPLVRLFGSSFLLALSDLLRPRRAVVLVDGVLVACNLLQAVPDLQWGWRFVLIAIPWLAMSATAGSGIALMSDILPRDAFVLGRSTLNTAVGVMQIAGFGIGGALVLLLEPSELFLGSAAAGLASLVLVRFGLADHPPRETGVGVVRRTREVNRALLGSRLLRPVYLCLWVPNGIIVGCEALFVPYAGGRAGWLFAAGATGMLLGDVMIGRFTPPAIRERLVEPLRLLLAVPFLAFALEPGVPLACLLAFVASAGYAASLPLQERLLTHTPAARRGQVLGLNSTGLMVMQGVGAVLGGTIAEVVGRGATGVGWTIAALAGLSLMVTVALTRGLRLSDPRNPKNEPVAHPGARTPAPPA